MRNQGFTLIDLIITLSIFSIVLSLGLPTFNNQLQQTRVKAATFTLQEALSLTRTKAVIANKRAVIKNQTDWSNGWEIFIDKDNDGLRDDDEEIVQLHEKLSGARITANRPVKDYVSYISTGESRNASGTDGGSFQAGTITICPTTKGKGYELILSRGGRVRQHEISAQDCAAI